MWDFHSTSCTLSSWVTTPPPQPARTFSFDDHIAHHPKNPSSSSQCGDDGSISASSFTNASGHSAVTVESSRRRPPVETTASSVGELMNIGDQNNSNHLWSHFLLSDDTCEDLHKYQPEIRENLLDAISLKSASSEGILEQAARDYLKKLDDSYCDDSLDKDYFTSNRSGFINGERLNKFSDLLMNDWSIATPHGSNYGMHGLSDYAPGRMLLGMDSERYPCKGQDNLNIESDAPYGTALGKYSDTTVGSLHQNGDKVASCGSARSLADLILFSSRLINKPSLDVKVPRPSSSPTKKQGPKNPSPAQGNGREHGNGTRNEGKRKRCDYQDSSSTEKLQKKHKHENSTVTTSSKVPVPKVKLGDRIATLQQIVSPFGKTDTASVLMEAIAYIKYLQEQVQLLISNPYLKTHPHREYSWGGLDRTEVRVDLKSRGLCLIPINSTPQAYRENTGSDYWAPPYRGGVFYR